MTSGDIKSAVWFLQALTAWICFTQGCGLWKSWTVFHYKLKGFQASIWIWASSCSKLGQCKIYFSRGTLSVSDCFRGILQQFLQREMSRFMSSLCILHIHSRGLHKPESRIELLSCLFTLLQVKNVFLGKDAYQELWREGKKTFASLPLSLYYYCIMLLPQSVFTFSGSVWVKHNFAVGI